MRTALAIACVAISAAAAVPMRAQTAAAPSVLTWIGHSAEIEAQLKTAAVERIEQIGTGVTLPRRAYVKPGGLFASLTWKVIPPGRRSGYWESYKSEIAAYELDKLLELNMVPPAVERNIDGQTGAAIMWIDGTRSVKENGGQMPAGPEWSKPSRRLAMFDNLIGNPDRNAGNILLGGPGEVVLIDHSRAFVSDKKMWQKFERVDAEIWNRLKALTRDDLRRVLGAWLDDRAIDAMIARRNEMAGIVDKLVAQRGAAAVIIP